MKTELNIVTIIRKIALVCLAVVLIRELVFCVLDMIIHTIFVAGVMLFLYVLFHSMYRNGGTHHYKVASWISFSAMIVIMITSIFLSPGWFESYEVVNGGIGVISVRVFQNNLFCISNGREDDVFLTWDNDVYISSIGNGQRALIEQFEKQTGKKVICEAYDESFDFYVDGEREDVHASGKVFKKNGYEIWKITAYHDQLKHKNILGGVYKTVKYTDWNMFDNYDEKGELIQ